MRSYILVAAVASRQLSYAEAKGQPWARLPRRLDDNCAVHGLGPEYTSGCGTGCECCRADGGCGECAGDHVCEFPYGGDYGVCTPCEERFAGDAGLIE